MKYFKKIIVTSLIAFTALSVSVNAEAAAKKQTTAAVSMKKTAKGKKTAGIKKGEVVIVQKIKGSYAKIKFDGKTGYVKKSKLKSLKKHYTRWTKVKLTQYKTLSLNAKKQTIKRNKRVTVVAKQGKYSYVLYKGKYGWVKTSKLQKTPLSSIILSSKTSKRKASSKLTDSNVINLTPYTEEIYTGTQYTPFFMTELNAPGFSAKNQALVNKMWDAIRTNSNSEVTICGYNSVGNIGAIQNAVANGAYAFEGTPSVGMIWGNNVLYAQDARNQLAKNEQYIKKAKSMASGYVNSNMSTKQKVNGFLTAITRNLRYQSLASTPNDVFNKKVGNCEGYSKLFHAMCLAYKIPCVKVSGTADGDNHMWNRVKIGSTWYYVDACWADNGSTIDYRYGPSKGLWGDHRL